MAMKNKPAGAQGVIIPVLNISGLMLRKDVVQTFAEGKFHTYPVSTIDECIVILTGVDARERDEEKNYPPSKRAQGFRREKDWNTEII